MAENQDLGQKGEDIACAFLEQLGLQVVERNWRYGREEIDIIAKTKHTLVFVEVKTRKSALFGAPALFVDKQKQRHLIKAAQGYVDRYKSDLEVRFDVVGILIDATGEQVEHIPNAFQPKW